MTTHLKEPPIFSRPSHYYTVPGIVRIKPISQDFIVEVVCTVCLTSMEVLKKRNRKRELVIARQFIYFFLRNRTSLTLKSIGELFSQDHTTVIHSLDTIGNLIDARDPSIMEMYREIKIQLN